MLRILIVDDSDRVRAGPRNLLDGDPKEWIVCGEACDGNQALEQASQLKPNVVLLDLSIPQVPGVEVARLLRELIPSATLIIMSAQKPKALPTSLKRSVYDIAFRSPPSQPI
jgi:DNA-binding NarL/FixJ family response regulator